MLEEENFIKEKIVSIIVEIAKREWPQRWQLFPHLFKLATSGRVSYLFSSSSYSNCKKIGH